MTKAAPLSIAANREDWLTKIAEGLRPWFDEAGYSLPPVRMAIGFTSTGRKGKRIGECWTNKASKDGKCEIFIVPSVDDPQFIAGVLAHELVHAAVGVEHGHKAPFAKACKALGLDDGKPKHALPGVRLSNFIRQLIAKAGPLPHARLSSDAESDAPKKQTARMLKCECPQCGYTVRTARKWLETAGAPICPVDQISMEHEPLNDTEDDGDGE
jgi:hypothetical protein